ncbi:MAG: ABC transporter substrate-binding protein, partial [Tardiphaga sp.]
MSNDPDTHSRRIDRRSLLRTGAAAALAAPLGVWGAQAFPFLPASKIDFSEFPICKASSDAPALTGAPRKLKFSWNAGAVCSVQLPVAIDHGFFARQNLEVELVNFSGSTDQLLEAIATGKSDAGVGMALRWLKPLEQGFDVNITAGIHGGCMRLIGSTAQGITTLQDLVGKTIATADMAS